MERVPILGRRLAFLLARPPEDPSLFPRILAALDRAADFYAEATGREPKPNRTVEGRITIAEVEGIGGAAWAYLGETGIEIQPAYLTVLLSAVRDQGLFDQPLFYELGRNYWFHGRQLDLDPGSVCTGYAVYMRFLAMESAGVSGAPFQGWPFEEFREAVWSMLEVFGTKTVAWEELLVTSPVPVHTFERPGRPPLTLSTADLIASLFHRLAGTDGAGFMRRFLQAADPLPPARNVRGVIRNLRAAAEAAAGRSLVAELERFRWPTA